jgi:hypothetical protein
MSGSGIRIVDMPDLGAVTDSGSVVGELAGSGRFQVTALRDYVAKSVSSTIYLRGYGAKGDGVTDDTAAINAALAAIPTNGGVIAFDPGANYLVSNTLMLTTSNTIFEGNGATLMSSSATVDIIQIGSAGATLQQFTVKDLKFWATVPKTAGACIRSLGALSNSSFVNVQFGSLALYAAASSTHRLWNGLDVTASFDRVVVDQACEIVVANHGVRAAGTSAAPASELHVNGRAMFCHYGVYVGGSANVYLNGEISGCIDGVYFDTALSGATNREAFFQQNSVVDGCSAYGVYVGPNSLAILDAHGAWFTSAGTGAYGLPAGAGVGFYFAPNSGPTPYCSALFDGVRLYNNAVTGMVNAGATMVLAASLINSNKDGVTLQGMGAQGSLIAGCLFAQNTGNSINVPAGITGYSIDGNEFYGNAGAIVGAGVAWTTSTAVRNNLGTPTANSGSVVLAAGTNPTATVTHGLLGPPASITLGGTSTLPVVITAETATTFTVEAVGTLASAVTVYWHANMGTNS